ncbi:hypothetical protein [Mycobacterium intermedium]|uniref:hypothetical protein n=1 Tax=Mycobacterium intermedium TaxID=28445 RepID=UPI00111C3701|nr:hypothetical protein [Mycobacterium intermedium]
MRPGPVDTGFGEAAGSTKEEADSALPRNMWVPAEQVAKAGVDGLAAGTPSSYPGRVNRVAAEFFRVAPRS